MSSAPGREMRDERRSGRAIVSINAGLRTDRGKRVPIVVKNISPHGFMAEAATTLVPGSAMVLDLGDKGLFDARVAWNRQGHLGAMFLMPMTNTTLGLLA